ncbi:MAG: alanine/glycine:cation symporter family protein [Rickettsiales bacterium]
MNYRKLVAPLFVLLLTMGIVFTIPSKLWAAAEEQASTDSFLFSSIKRIITAITNHMNDVLFYKVPFLFDMPLLVIWLIFGAVFFTVRLGFINIFMFGHAVKVVSGKYDNKDDPGEVSHFQALTAAVSATVGLGNIAGVAVAVAMGGPGAVVWMSIAGIFGMSTKFAEVVMGHKYREIDENGKVSGGAFHYLRKGLAEKNMPRLGRVLAAIFAVLCIIGSIGSVNIFQANQTVALLKDNFTLLGKIDWLVALILAVSVGFVLIGGIKRIASTAEKIVPLMAIVYVSACLIVIFANIEHLGEAIRIMFVDAFGLSAVGGGITGAIIAGFRRATFSNEAGVGSAPIAHAAARTKEPVREGCVALLEPFIDTVVICFMTGLVITITGVYTDPAVAKKGIIMTSMAFETVIYWFPMVLSFAVALFAFSTMITWSYYGERAWEYIFGKKNIRIFHIIFCVSTFIGGMIDLELIVNLVDALMIIMAVPNLIGLYILSNDLSKDLASYKKRLKQGEFDTAG